MAKRKRRKFSDAFKREAVELSCSPGLTQKRVCEQLDISSGLLHRWRRELLGPSTSRPAKGDAAVLRKDLVRAKADLAEKDAEIKF